VRGLGELFDDAQARANGLVQEVEQPAVGRVSLLGSVFRVDGAAAPARRPAPRLDEHAGELLAQPAASPSAGSTWART
jgi:crotonobetainyl-CoA:carnitine CoA-transferase CaiB-like acyl-CoA transferase